MSILKERVHPLVPQTDNACLVRVAILDTGANFNKRMNFLYKNRIKDYWSWCGPESHVEGRSVLGNDGQPILPEGQDEDGHGTHIMSVLLQVAPVCQVYIAKVFETHNDLTDEMPSPTMAKRIANVRFSYRGAVGTS